MTKANFASQQPDKTAYIMSDTGLKVSYQTLEEKSNQLAHWFRENGLNVGDGIAMVLENHLGFFPVVWGAHRAGLYYTAINHHLHADEIAYIINDCQAKVLISSVAFADKLPLILAQVQIQYCLILGGEIPQLTQCLDYDQSVEHCPKTPISDQTHGMDMLYSSGTTGRPKGIKKPLSGAALEEILPASLLLMHLFKMTPDACYLSPAPLYHAAPLRFSMTIMRAGGTVLVMDKFKPERALELIDHYRPSHSQWVPTMFVQMLKCPEAIRKRYNVESMKVAIHAAAPCPLAMKQQMIQWWGNVFYEYYAGTEANGLTLATPEDWQNHKGSVGKALLGELHILNEQGQEVPCGEVGTVYFGNGPDFEYHNDLEKTKSAKNHQGWSTLGDIGYVDQDGFLYLTDRKAHMIISGGVNIYPQEIENLLIEHPMVSDVAVFGIPDPEFGEAVKAVVKLIDPHCASKTLEQTLIDYCRDRMAHFKCPKTIDFNDQLPRDPTGKLIKRLLKDQYIKKLSSQGA